jgi:hypothetical protein
LFLVCFYSSVFFSSLSISTSQQDEPLYGKQYLPRKFKIGVTVPGDNSIDIYISDIGLVVITDPANNDGKYIRAPSTHASRTTPAPPPPLTPPPHPQGTFRVPPNRASPAVFASCIFFL